MRDSITVCGRTAHRIVGLLLLFLTLLAFARVSRNGFIGFDDDMYLTANPVVAAGISAVGLRWALTATEAANWHPFTWFSHMLDVQLFGMNPGAHHLVSLAIHAVNVLLLLCLFLGLTGDLWPCALVAALFAVHPLHVESVAWAAERKDVLSTFFALVAMLAYLHAVRRGAVLRSFILPLFFASALLAKSMPVTLPFLLLLIDWWPLGRWRPALGRPANHEMPHARLLPPLRLWLEKLPLFFLAAGAGTVTLWVQTHAGAVAPREVLPLVVRAANALLAYAGYLVQGCWPTGLAIHYGYPPRMPSWYRLAGSFSLLATLSLLAFAVARRRPWVAVGWLWYLGSLVPVIGIVQVGAQARADRYTYLPLTGIFLALAWSLVRLVDRRPSLRVPIAAAATAVVLALGIQTARQVGFWRDSGSLFSQALAADPGNAIAHNNLGLWLVGQHRLDEALFHHREAVRLSPGTLRYLANLGAALESRGDVAEAEECYRRALAIDPADATALINIGNLARGRGDPARALTAYRAALRGARDRPEIAGNVHFNIAVVLQASGDPVGAAAEYRATLELNPRDADAMNNLGNILVSQGRTAEALPLFRTAVGLAPASAPIRFNLGNALVAQGDLEGGMRQLREASAIDPADAEALVALGGALDRLGRREEAAAAYARAGALHAANGSKP